VNVADGAMVAWKGVNVTVGGFVDNWVDAVSFKDEAGLVLRAGSGFEVNRRFQRIVTITTKSIRTLET
jgi:hypothetical protein